MFFKRLLEIFVGNAQSKIKKVDINCTECGLRSMICGVQHKTLGTICPFLFCTRLGDLDKPGVQTISFEFSNGRIFVLVVFF